MGVPEVNATCHLLNNCAFHKVLEGCRAPSWVKTADPPVRVVVAAML